MLTWAIVAMMKCGARPSAVFLSMAICGDVLMVYFITSACGNIVFEVGVAR